MHSIIDFDDPTTFPVSLGVWDKKFESFIRESIHLACDYEGWQINLKLQDLHIERMSIVTDFVSSNPDVEIAVCHVTRLLDPNMVLDNGLITEGGRNSLGEKRIRDLLEYIGLNKEMIKRVFEQIYYYWDRDGGQRTNSVHFMFDKRLVYRDDACNEFAISLGGEILRWALYNIDPNLYKIEPYKRLWIEGIPLIVKFKCKLSNINDICRNGIIAEIVKYNIAKKIFHYSYEFDFTGMTNGPVEKDDIIEIEEIKGFIEMQEKYEEYRNFYE